ncbi:hypothetical protein [Ramlibacter albus]|uniref:Uncharacterized protein n=1 Tax=Ramlibacter albus TaxID=2079448 RepID=A0A923M8N1_9BURK|nr:hypothetical protein [Ramlibacter albus]MBC5764923.1 hypothetical protein [Ramlibacter albus]
MDAAERNAYAARQNLADAKSRGSVAARKAADEYTSQLANYMKTDAYRQSQSARASGSAPVPDRPKALVKAEAALDKYPAAKAMVARQLDVDRAEQELVDAVDAIRQNQGLPTSRDLRNTLADAGFLRDDVTTNPTASVRGRDSKEGHGPAERSARPDREAILGELKTRVQLAERGVSDTRQALTQARAQADPNTKTMADAYHTAYASWESNQEIQILTVRDGILPPLSAKLQTAEAALTPAARKLVDLTIKHERAKEALAAAKAEFQRANVELIAPDTLDRLREQGLA